MTAERVLAGAAAAGTRSPGPARVARAGEVLDLVRRGTATTTSELAAAMGLARSTVAERVELLVDRGLLVAQDELVTRRGRPPTVLAFNPRAGVVLTAQLGMSGARVGVADLGGDLLATRAVDVEIGVGPDDVLALLEREFGRALEQAGETREQVFGIGVGLPGRVELETAPGVGTSATRPWRRYPIDERLAAAFGVPVVVGRGVSLLALAEHRAFWPSSTVLLGVKVGSVVECGIVVDGRIVAGGDNLAGEIGHTPVAGSDALCACGNRGCLNAVAGGSALARYLAAQGHHAESARDVARLAQDGVVLAGQTVREAGRHIGEVLAGAVNLLNPDVITVWGYLADAGDQLFAGMRETIYRSGVPAATHHVRLEHARLGDDAGIRGAAITVIEEVLRPESVDQYVLATAAGS